MALNKKIFIIDDEQNVRNSIRRLINENFSSVEVIDFDDGEKMLSVVENSKPDLILLDVLMPGMNGLQVLKLLKESEDKEIREIPVFVLTGVSNREIAVQSAKYGAADYITKPFNEKVFLMKIKNCLR